MDIENILARAAENLSVRRVFGAAYEKDGMVIIPVALVAGGGGGGGDTAPAWGGEAVVRPDDPPGAGPTGQEAASRTGAHGCRRGLRRAAAAVRRVRREGRPGPLGTRGGADDRRPGFASSGAGVVRAWTRRR